MRSYVYRPVEDFISVSEALQEVEISLSENELSTIPTFTNSWVDEGSVGWLPVGFWKTLHGVVYLEGRIKSGTIGLGAFTLPRFYRPVQDIVFATVSNDLFGQLKITEEGVIMPLSPSSNVWVSLSGIVFKAQKEE